MIKIELTEEEVSILKKAIANHLLLISNDIERSKKTRTKKHLTILRHVQSSVLKLEQKLIAEEKLYLLEKIS